MGRMWCVALVMCVAACGAPIDSDKDSDWELTENNQTSNNQTSNNQTSNNQTSNNQTSNNQTSNNQTSNNQTSNNQTTACIKAPVIHRPDATECDDVRGPGADVDPDHPAVSCLDDAACTDGANGRCIGNGHDGYYCSYDQCFADAECGNGSVCECEGGWRGDQNVCLGGNCATDSDCGETGFCSPSQGDCGAFGGIVGYFCHSCADECVDDTDCGDGSGDAWGSYCMYDQGVGHFRCSNSQCAG